MGEKNPYSAFASKDDLSGGSPPVRGRLSAGNYIAAIVCVTGLLFVEFLVVDYITVYIQPVPTELFPLIPLFLLIVMRRKLGLCGWSIAGALLAGYALSLPLVATVGRWFHLAIGGTS